VIAGIRQFAELLLIAAALVAAGCGTTKTQIATEQLLVSGAIDDAVATIDFRDLAGTRVYFDTQYINNIKGLAYANADYVVSSLRQQMVAAGCLLLETRDEADIIVEARVGAIGTDGHEIIYGLPANNSIASAAALVPNAPLLPAIPEISLARKNAQVGAAKIAVFAYHRESRQPVWQSGVSLARSTSQNFWLFGAGPFQHGTIHEGTQFAGERLAIPGLADSSSDHPNAAIAYDKSHLFDLRSPRRATLPQLSGWGNESSGQGGGVTDPSGETGEPLFSQDWPSLEPRLASPLETQLDWR